MSKKQDDSYKYTSATVQRPDAETEIIDLVRTTFVPRCHIRKISKTEYIKGTYTVNGFVSDGEVYTVAKKEGAMRNRRSLRQIFRTLRQLISTNFSGGDNELFLTLTYAEQHHDQQRIYTDIELFWRRLKYHCASADLKYIAIVEPHASGNYHVHMLIADTAGQALYIQDSDIRRLWGHGITQTERLYDIDHMGAYFIAYFTNLELSPDEIKIYAEQDDVETRNGKSYIKGKRLDYYPEHMRIYRHSRNCNKPEKVSESAAEDAIAGAKRTYTHTATFEDGGKSYEILTEQYRKNKPVEKDVEKDVENLF